MKAESAASSFLRRALLANGTFSLISGIILIVAAKPLAEIFGLAMPRILIAVGTSLLIYAAALFHFLSLILTDDLGGAPISAPAQWCSPVSSVGCNTFLPAGRIREVPHGTL